jgi:phthiodiolone/phenolphthiodiolone dimycocerosates ketoreductase
MSHSNVETAVILWGDRHFPAQIVQDQCRALAAGDAVDGVLFADQLVNFIPIQLWNERNTPLAKVMRDPDSHSDALIIAAYALAAAPDLQLHISTDTVRRAPAEFIQSMLTLANITQGRATFHIGAGENKQCAPYGHKRSQGPGRMRELFEVFNRIMADDGPIDYEGKYIHFNKASIGSAKPYRPRIWGLGGGPKLIDHTAHYADGLAATAPLVWSTPEQVADVVQRVRGQVAAYGRDPDRFRFALWCPMLIHEDPAEIERGMRSPLVHFMTGIFGRIHMPDWEKEGLVMPAPADWGYFKDLLPYDTDDAFIRQILETVTEDHVRKGWYIGSPGEIAKQIQPLIDVGVDWIMPLDYLSMVSEPDEAEASFRRSVEVCAALKAANPKVQVANT